MHCKRFMQRTMRTYRESETKQRVWSSRRGNVHRLMYPMNTQLRILLGIQFGMVVEPGIGSQRSFCPEKATSSDRMQWGQSQASEARVARSRIPREGQSLSLALTEASISYYRRDVATMTYCIVCSATFRRRFSGPCVFNIQQNLHKSYRILLYSSLCQMRPTGIFWAFKKSHMNSLESYYFSKSHSCNNFLTAAKVSRE